MSSDLTLYELTGSPNSVKVRVALGYKKLAHTRIPAELGASFPGDRSTIASRSRQPRLPVLQHGKTVIFDSAAILRYLEANFPETPPIYSTDYAEFGEIDRWEQFSKAQFSEPIGMLFEQAFSPERDAAVIARANSLLHDRTGPIEDRVTTGQFLVGDRLSGADIVCASSLYMADMSEAFAAHHPVATFFHENLQLGEGRDATRSWMRRVLVHDPVLNPG